MYSTPTAVEYGLHALLHMDGNHWGIVPGYEDARGEWRETPGDTRAALLKAMRVSESDTLPGAPPVRVVGPGDPSPLEGAAELVLEEGGTLRVEGSLPEDLPYGYHRLRAENGDGETSLGLVASPLRCPLPRGLPTWGFSAQVHSVRSDASWGIGDFSDLKRLARWSAGELGAGVLLVSPLHAPTPVLPQQPSPYFPSSRRFRNLLYLAIEEVPGASEARLDLDRFAGLGRALNERPILDRDAVFRLKLEALESLWARRREDDGLERYRSEQGPSLETYATFCVIAERHGADWRQWPGELRRPEARAVRELAAASSERVRFHAWVQWLLDEQLARAHEEIRLMQDLPVGIDPGGADAWEWQDLLALDASVGAPPDLFNTRGQDWGMPPFVPHRLQAAEYRPFVEIVRATLRHAGALRIDHVMGLFRLFWIPSGVDPGAGSFVLYPARDLLAIVALECHRAGALVVGEDLGTVAGEMRDALAEAAILSYRLMWFETGPPESYPELALAAVTTHDLPTIAGLWSGDDLEAQRQLGLEPNEEGTLEIRDRLREMGELEDDAAPEEAIVRAHELLARAPSLVTVATLEDATAAHERPNIPQSGGRPNWSLALSVTLEELEEHPLARRVAGALGRRDS